MIRYNYNYYPGMFSICHICGFNDKVKENPDCFDPFNRVNKYGKVICCKCLEQLEIEDPAYALGIMGYMEKIEESNV